MKMILMAIILNCGLLAGHVQAQDLESEIAVCNDCHGPAGISQHPDIPIIAGQSAFFLEDTLLAYAAEERACQKSEFRHGDTERDPVTMCEETARLDESMLVEIAEHYSNLPFVRATQDFDAAQAETGAKIHDRYCERCHSEGGSYRDDDAGILAGQWTEFLRSTIEEYRSGTRPMSAKMASAFEELTEEEFEALLNFYASPMSGG